MTLVRQWAGIKEKPPTFFDPSAVDPSWSWAHQSLVCAWLFNEPGGDTLRDVLGRVNGTLVAGTGSKPTWNRDGELWGLTPIDSGADSGVDIPGDGSALGDDFTPTQLSVETWSRWTADDGTDPRLFSKATSTASADHWIMVGSSDSSENLGQPRFRLKTGGSTTTHRVNGDETRPLVGDLVHAVWTYDGATVLCYLNAVDTFVGPGGSQTGTVDGGTGVPIRIGNAPHSGATNEFDASIYKIAIYRSALSQAQVFALCYDPYGPFRPVRRRSVVAVTAAITGSITEGATAGDTVVAVLSALGTWAEGVLAGDAYNAALAPAIGSVTEGAQAGETWAGLMTTLGQVAEGAKAGDLLAGKNVMAAAISDGAITTDNLVGAVVASMQVTEGALAGDTLAGLVVMLESIADGAKAGEVWAGNLLMSVLLADGAKAGDTMAGTISGVITGAIAEGAAAGDSWVAVLDALGTWQEGTKAGDAWQALAQYASAFSDGAEAGDAFVGQLITQAGIQDGAKAGEAFVAAVLFQLSMVEGARLGDTWVSVHQLVAPVSEGSVAGELFTSTLGALASLAEGVRAGDVFTAGNQILVSIAEGVLVGDAFAAIITRTIDGLCVVPLVLGLVDTAAVSLPLADTASLALELQDTEAVNLPLCT